MLKPNIKKHLHEKSQIANKFGICDIEILIMGWYGQMLAIFYSEISLFSTVGNLRLINNYGNVLSLLSLHRTLGTTKKKAKKKKKKKRKE